MLTKTRIVALICGAFCTTAALLTVTASSATPLTLAAAIDAALAKSPETREAEARSRSAEAARDQASRSWAPQIALLGAAGYRRLENDRRIALGLSSPDEQPLFAAVEYNQRLFDFGRRNADVQARSALVEAAYMNTQSVGQVTMLTASQAWLDLLLYTRTAAAAADNLEFHRKLASDMREGVTKGALSISERQQADERLQQALVRDVDARQQLAQSRARFAAITGLTADDTITPDSLPWPDTAGPVLPASLTEFITAVKSDNARLREARLNLQAAQADLRRVRADYLPTVDLSGTAKTGKDYDGYLGRTENYQALATLRVPVFDGGVTAARVREAQGRADAARFALEAAERDGELQARVFWQRRDTMRTRLTVEEERARVAAEVLDSYKSQFIIGRRSLLDVLDAQAAVYGAKVDAETARVTALVAELSLLAAANRMDDYFGRRQSAPGSAAYGPQ